MKKKIGIVGLGLMGGSLALALKNKNWYFLGLDHNKKHQKEAIELNIVDDITDSLDEIIKCDIVILSIPVDGIIEVISKFKNIPKNTTIIDLGSTKEKISLSIPKDIRENFVTAHPMTGTEKFGPKWAFKELYSKKVVVLCDLQKSGEHQTKEAKELFNSIDMKIVSMDSKEHDRHASYISHMPHAISYALANSVMSQEDAMSIVNLAGGGFKDMSRIAKSSPSMWEDIFRQNRDNLLESLHAFQTELKKCENMVKNEEWSHLNSWMQEANSLHDILE